MIDTVRVVPGPADLVAEFARRTGGVSEPPYDTLNLGVSAGDHVAAVVENRRRLAAHLGVRLEACFVAGQTHGAALLRVTRARCGEGVLTARAPSQADALLLIEPGVFALALSADCPLILCADPRRRLAGIAHAGWRGTAAGIVERLVDALLAEGAVAGDLIAGISPGICGACYPVGEEVFQALAGRPGLARARRGLRLDLRAVHRAILEEAGVPGEAIAVSADCSAHMPERYFSHRREAHRTGRNGALIGWRR